MIRPLRIFGILALLALLLGVPGIGRAQSGTRTFPETGKTVAGTFLTYWDTHGALAQQGFPISQEMQEKSDLNGQTYSVQYFERAVFEHHPENAGSAFEVLLSQLGTFRYKAKYPNGAPGQHASTDNARQFPQTGHALGGKFRAYWETHGALPQQGFPISDEFTEVSDLNGKPYTVQYFERAVFELHPENAGTPFEVLLSQLGTFQYRCKYQGGPCAGGAAGQPTAGPTVAPTTVPPAPTSQADACGDVPASQNMTVTPRCGPPGTRFSIEGTGFTPGEKVGRYYTSPSGGVGEGSSQSTADSGGNVTGITFITTSNTPQGVWAGTFEGVTSHHKAIAYFRVGGASAPPPPSGSCDTSGSVNGSAQPSTGRPGDTLIFTATGFQANEDASLWFTTPGGIVIGTRAPGPGLVQADGRIVFPFPVDQSFASAAGRWAITFQGAASHHQAVIYFCISP